MNRSFGHQGGLLNSASARAIAPIPIHRNNVGGKQEELPAGVKAPLMRQAISAIEVCQRKWVREIIERNGSAEEMLTTASKSSKLSATTLSKVVPT